MDKLRLAPGTKMACRRLQIQQRYRLGGHNRDERNGAYLGVPTVFVVLLSASRPTESGYHVGAGVAPSGHFQAITMTSYIAAFETRQFER
jgi:hypothetical protein